MMANIGAANAHRAPTLGSDADIQQLENIKTTELSYTASSYANSWTPIRFVYYYQDGQLSNRTRIISIHRLK